jgi:hypothetical protein
MNDLERLTAAMQPIQRDTFAWWARAVINGHRTSPIDPATIVVRNGRIAAVGPSARRRFRAVVPAVDVAGKTIIPGLWDMHAHASQMDWAPVYLASGVTSSPRSRRRQRLPRRHARCDSIGAGLGPRYCWQALVDGPGRAPSAPVTAASPDEGRAVVRPVPRDGFEQMKIYTLVAPDVVAVDRRRSAQARDDGDGARAAGHDVAIGRRGGLRFDRAHAAARHGWIRRVESPDRVLQSARYRDGSDRIVERAGWSSRCDAARELPPWRRAFARELTRMFASMPGGNGDPQATHARLIEGVRLLKAAVDAGLVVVAGTDKGVPGFSLQRELELYVEGGMTPLEALQAATLMPAHAMKLDREVGTIDVGKRADLVVLDADPLVNISNIRTARMVLANGRLYDCNALWKAAGFAPR